MSNILAKFRLCCHCGHFVGHSRIICRACESEIKKNMFGGWAQGYGLPVFSLYEWINENEYLTRSVALAIKGGEPQAAITYFAKLLLRQRLQLLPRPTGQKWVFVPAPAAKKGALDHAGVLARTLSELSGGEFLSCLVRENATAQKKNKLVARRRGEKISNSSQRTFQSEERVIFIDDIITSGATAHSGHMALFQPSTFEIWTIFHRPRLR